MMSKTDNDMSSKTSDTYEIALPSLRPAVGCGPKQAVMNMVEARTAHAAPTKERMTEASRRDTMCPLASYVNAGNCRYMLTEPNTK